LPIFANYKLLAEFKGLSYVTGVGGV